MSSWERAWVVEGDHQKVFNCSKPVEFDLKRNGAGGMAFYEVIMKGDDRPAEWDNCRPVPRGRKDLVWPNPDDRLPAYSETSKERYREAAEAHLKLATSSTRRLEGELEFEDRTLVVYFFIVKNAIQTTDNGIVRIRDLLIVISSASFSWSPDADVDSLDDPVGDPIDDGTATGNPK